MQSSMLKFAKSSSVTIFAVCVSQMSSNGSQFDRHFFFSKEITHEPKEYEGEKQHGTLAQSVPL